MLFHLETIIHHISSFSVILPFVILLIFCKRVWSFNPWVLLYIANHFVSEVITFTMALKKMHNLFIIDLFSIIEGSMLILIYYKSYKEALYKKAILKLLPAYIIFQILVCFGFDIHGYLRTYTYAIHSIVMLIPIILYFWERMKLMDDVYITTSPMFWISSGFLIFYSANILYYSFYNYLFYHHYELLLNSILLHSFTLILMNILLSKGLWQIQKT